MDKLTDSEVVKKSLEISVQNGMEDYKEKTIPRRGLGKGFMDVWVDSDNVMTPPEVIILSHGFCRAFWGEEPSDIVWIGCGVRVVSRDDKPPFPIWKFHLQQMILAENRVDYLREYLTD